MKSLKSLNYGIVGLGIMGGSFAKAIRLNILSQNGSTGKILVCNRSTACLSQAVSEGIADEAYTSDRVQEMLPKCDVLFICLYPHATLDFLKTNKEFFKSGAIVTDISGVKGIFEKELPEILRSDVDFIIGRRKRRIREFEGGIFREPQLHSLRAEIQQKRKPRFDEGIHRVNRIHAHN